MREGRKDPTPLKDAGRSQRGSSHGPTNDHHVIDHGRLAAAIPDLKLVQAVRGVELLATPARACAA